MKSKEKIYHDLTFKAVESIGTHTELTIEEQALLHKKLSKSINKELDSFFNDKELKNCNKAYNIEFNSFYI